MVSWSFFVWYNWPEYSDNSGTQLTNNQVYRSWGQTMLVNTTRWSLGFLLSRTHGGCKPTNHLVGMKWSYPHSCMVYFMENPIKIADDWGYPHFRKPPYLDILETIMRWDLDGGTNRQSKWGLQHVRMWIWPKTCWMAPPSYKLVYKPIIPINYSYIYRGQYSKIVRYLKTFPVFLFKTFQDCVQTCFRWRSQPAWLAFKLLIWGDKNWTKGHTEHFLFLIGCAISPKIPTSAEHWQAHFSRFVTAPIGEQPLCLSRRVHPETRRT